MFLSLLIILIIVLVAGAFFLLPSQPGGDGHDLLEGLSQIRRMTEGSDEDKGGTATIYKWQDAAGEWHFSNTPPPEGTAVQVKTYRTDVNVIQATREAPAAKTAPAPRTESSPAPSSTPIPGLPAADKVKKLMDDVQKIKQSSEDRTAIIDRQIDASQ